MFARKNPILHKYILVLVTAKTGAIESKTSPNRKKSNKNPL